MTSARPKAQTLAINGEAPLKKLRVNIDESVEDFVRRLEYEHRVSKSSIVELALLWLQAQGDEAVAELIHNGNASLRRR